MGFTSPLAPSLVYQTVLTADALTIDTGANAIPAGGSILEIYLYARTDEAATSSTIGLQFNGDTGSNYDRNRSQITNVTATYSSTNAATFTAMVGAAASNAAGVFSQYAITLPAYAGTVGNKAGTLIGGVPDTTAGNLVLFTSQFQWRSTAAINQATFIITSGAGQKFKAGSSVYVYVR